MMRTVVVIGGYGNFGQVISRRLAALPSIHLIVAGHDAGKARLLADSIGARAEEIDSNDPKLAETLKRLGAHVVIHCAGPFQSADYRVALASSRLARPAPGTLWYTGWQAMAGLLRRSGPGAISAAVQGFTYCSFFGRPWLVCHSPWHLVPFRVNTSGNTETAREVRIPAWTAGEII